MSNFPLISVVIPVYNHEKYIKQALDSVLDEDYPNKEIVVINDGSVDNTDSVIKDWIKEHKDKISVIYKSRENKKLVKTLNELIDLSNGEYIVFFGSDDYLKNNGIRKRYEYLRAHPDKLMVLADCNLIDGEGNFIKESALIAIGRVNKKLLFSDNGMKKFMILNGYTPGATLMADKKVYQLLGKYDETFPSEDWPYYMKAVPKNILGYIDDIVSAYRIHEKNSCYSEKQILNAHGHLKITLQSFKDFKEIKYKYYLILKLFYLILYIPYLKIKFILIKKSKNYTNFLDSCFNKLILNFIITLKDIFNYLTCELYEK